MSIFYFPNYGGDNAYAGGCLKGEEFLEDNESSYSLFIGITFLFTTIPNNDNSRWRI